MQNPAKLSRKSSEAFSTSSLLSYLFFEVISVVLALLLVEKAALTQTILKPLISRKLHGSFA
ncbi:hypothetical protein H6F90_29020 [Trichocoleus sp. FACHB-591]|uniref:hypothetical protein n=1 Tax=Trichocoleus sp. FACHB-591 TaxID=2692872 RepID=UPI0016847E46|nr:hypothetical protein [Trichocoleus sp. FACHB-591]MBD2099108.1 hypothetical protein [Trichocoleus sp. FACHB-591]